MKTANTEEQSEQFIIANFKKEGGVDVVESFLQNEFKEYNEEVTAEVPQIDSEDGRKRIRELAAQTNKKLSELDTPIRNYLRYIKKQPKLIEQIAKENKESFTDLRLKILKPLTEAQASQDAVIEWLTNAPAMCSQDGITSKDLGEYIRLINEYTADLVWPELKKKFKIAHENALTTATVNLERAIQSEKQTDELEELRKEKAAAEQAEYNRKITEEAATKAREEAEQKAQREREAAERRAVEAKQREEASKMAEQKAIRDAELAKEQQAEAAKQAKINADNERAEAEKRQALAVEQAKQAEAKRIADEEAAQQQAAKDREADKAHKIAINRAALVDLVAAGVDEETAKTVIRAIGRKEVRNISIQY